MRFDHGESSFVYSSDTGPGWSLSELGPTSIWPCARPRCSTPSGPTICPISRPLQAGLDAKESGAGRLVVTHYSPDGDPADYEAEAQAAFGRPVHIAAPHERYDV